RKVIGGFVMKRKPTMKGHKAIREVEGLPLQDHPNLKDPRLRKVGEGVYYVETFRFARDIFNHYVIDLKDDLNGTDWTDTMVTAAILSGGGNQGRDHWGWPGEPFAWHIIATVTPEGLFFYALQTATPGGEDVGSSIVVASAFRWIRRGEHGVTGRTWDAS